MVRLLKNQTLYQCDYCNKRLISKQGAKLHEEKYCRKSPVVLEQGRKIIENCDHRWLTSWMPIPGEEHRSQPDYDYCANCGVKSHEFADGTSSNPKALYRAVSYYAESDIYQNHERQFEALENDSELPF